MGYDHRKSFSVSIRESVIDRFNRYVKRISTSPLDEKHKRGYTLEAAINNFLEATDVRGSKK